MALDNGVTSPPMGFNPWNCFGTTSHGTQKLPGSHGWAHDVKASEGGRRRRKKEEDMTKANKKKEKKKRKK